jgi:hypothetical protein
VVREYRQRRISGILGPYWRVSRKAITSLRARVTNPASVKPVQDFAAKIAEHAARIGRRSFRTSALSDCRTLATRRRIIGDGQRARCQLVPTALGQRPWRFKEGEDARAIGTDRGIVNRLE